MYSYPTSSGENGRQTSTARVQKSFLAEMSNTWVCSICQQAMPVSYGPYHLIEDSHIERLLIHVSLTTKNASFITTEQDRKASGTLPADNPAAALRVSPINAFFKSFPSFKFDPTKIPSKSYRLLEKHHGKHSHSSQSKKIWERYQKALTEEFDLWFGSEDDLEAWHALCCAVGISPLPTSCESCEEVSVHQRRTKPICLLRLQGREKLPRESHRSHSLGPQWWSAS